MTDYFLFYLSCFNKLKENKNAAIGQYIFTSIDFFFQNPGRLFLRIYKRFLLSFVSFEADL